MDRQDLKRVMIDQRAFFTDHDMIVDRNVDLDWYLKGGEVVVISGIRRCGKSTLLKIISERLKDPWIFLDLDDIRLIDLSIDDIQTLGSISREITGHPRPVYLLDEVQNFEDWDRWVADLYKKGTKTIITGSNSALLGPEISTHLTGRNKTLVLYPFSFEEYLRLKDVDHAKDASTTQEDRVRSAFASFMRMGGFPLIIKNDDLPLSRQYLDDILHRDIVARYNIRQVHELKDIVVFLLTNVGSVVPYSSLQTLTGIRSASTVKRFIDHLISVFLIFRINRFDYSVKKQTPQKYYAMDMSFLETSSFNTSENIGKRLENIVAIELMRRKKTLFYHRQRRECDFITKVGFRIDEAIQVTATMEDPRVRKREIEGLEEAMETYDLKEGIILTMDTHSALETDNGRIEVLPIWKWMLDRDR